MQTAPAEGGEIFSGHLACLLVTSNGCFGQFQVKWYFKILHELLESLGLLSAKTESRWWEPGGGWGAVGARGVRASWGQSLSLGRWKLLETDDGDSCMTV